MGYEIDYELVQGVFDELAKKVQMIAAELLDDEMDLDLDHVLHALSYLLILFNEWGNAKGLLKEKLFKDIHRLFELVGEEDPVTTKSIQEIADNLDECKDLFTKLIRCKDLSEEMGKEKEFNQIALDISRMLESNQYVAICHRDDALEEAMENGDEVAISSYQSFIDIYTTFIEWFKELSSDFLGYAYYLEYLINEEWDYRAFTLINVKDYDLGLNETWSAFF